MLNLKIYRPIICIGTLLSRRPGMLGSMGLWAARVAATYAHEEFLDLQTHQLNFAMEMFLLPRGEGGGEP